MDRATAAGVLVGAAVDAVVGDPRRGHPVAAFGAAASALEKRIYRDSRVTGALFTAACVCGAGAVGVAADRLTRTRPLARVAVTAAATWAVLGGTTLAREGAAMAASLEAGDIEAARERLPHLCGRDPSGLDSAELARGTVESIAENTSDAVVGPLVWGAVLGLPGLLGYRVVNTLDAMVGHRSPRYERFGWASARLDDLANLVPARLTALLTVAFAGTAGGSPRVAAAVVLRDGHRHPSPNSGRCEAAFAGALGVRLGGANDYGGRVEHRPELGDGPRPRIRDIRRSVRLARVVSLAAVALSATVAAKMGSRRRPPGGMMGS
ncbi:cobalamin biosynthesis protein [Microbispora sp. RL4-1S]|uniref:Cobalamin biosynthesis protein CobD n=1 Tax=Microbispora oryzae TaxID=2806554 RepID=A0A940WCD7_9ACTN|nr:cobalamin biosynthesis protein [Microbispora oryzae]MBP2702905.1 cobalamin biosynthesis protein [Microbispora oryzae]